MKSVRDFEAKFLQFMRDRKADVIAKLKDTNDLTAEVEAGIRAGLDEFKKGYKPVVA